MPNCDFYAALEDHASLLDWLFHDGRCEVFESYSEFERPLAQFGSATFGVIVLPSSSYVNFV